MTSSENSSAQGTEASPRRPRRFWRVVRVALFAGLILLAAAYLGRETLIGPLVIQQVQRVVAEDFGIQLQVGGTGGNYLGTFELLDVSVGAVPAAGLESATVELIAVRYSLLGLLRGTPGALHRAQISGADAVFDLDSLDLEAESPDVEWPSWEELPEVILEAARLRVRMRQGQDELEVEDLDLRLPKGALDPASQQTAGLTAGPTRLRAGTTAAASGQGEPGFDTGLDSGLDVEWPSWTAQLQRRGDQLEIRRLSAGGDLWLERAALGIEAALDGRIQLDAEAPLAGGRLALDASLQADGLSLTRCELEGPGLRADLAGTRLQWLPTTSVDLVVSGESLGDTFAAGHVLTLETRAVLDENGSWQLPALVASGAGARLEVSGLELDWDADAERLSASLDTAQVGARGHPLSLTAPARLAWSQAGQLVVESMQWAGAGGEVSLSGQVDIQDTAADLRLVARNIHPTGLLRAFVPELPGFELLELLEVDVSGPPDARNTSLSLSVLGVSGVAERPLDVQLEARHGATSLDVDLLEVSVAGQLLASGTAHMALQDGWPHEQAGAVGAALSFDLNGAPDILGTLPFDVTRLGGEMTLNGEWPRPEMLLTVHGDALRIPDMELPDAARWPDVRAQLQLAEGVLALTALTVDANVIQLTASGRCEGLLDMGRDAKGWPTLTLDRGAALEGRVDVAGEQSALLIAALPGVRRAAGRIDAALRIDGTLDNPRVQGPVTIAGGDLALEAGGVASLTGLEGSAHFDAPLSLASDTPGPRVVVRDVQLVGELGAAPFSVSGGMTWTQPEADTITAGLEVDLLLDGEELLLYRGGGMKLRADTHLRLHGPWQAMAVTGSVGITDGRMTRHLSLLDLGGAEAPLAVRLDRLAVTQAPWNATTLDIALTTLEPMRVSNRLIRASARLDARLEGTGADPQLTGNMFVERAKVELPLWTFLVDRASIQFDKRSLLYSELSGTARSRMLGYDVLAVLSGPLEEPEVRLTSLPPLPEDDLLNLLLTGQLPDEGAFAEDSRVLTGVAIYLGKDLLSRTLGDESTESSESFLSRFEVETGRNQRRTGSETLDVRFRMLDNLFTNDDSVYIEVEQSEFDETNGSLRFVFRLK